jgi:hypothetical protein
MNVPGRRWARARTSRTCAAGPPLPEILKSQCPSSKKRKKLCTLLLLLTLDRLTRPLTFEKTRSSEDYYKYILLNT